MQEQNFPSKNKRQHQFFGVAYKTLEKTSLTLTLTNQRTSGMRDLIVHLITFALIKMFN